jgi:hypothetical protein
MKEAMKLALEALWTSANPKAEAAIAAIKEALAKQEQGEPAPAQELDFSEKGRNRSAVLGNNVEAMMDAGLPFLKALETTLKIYDHPTPPAAQQAPVQQEQGEPAPAQQEPVAWRWKHGDSCWQLVDVQPRSPTAQPLYTTPPQRKPLTRKQIDELADERCFLGNIYEITAEIEAAHDIKENT